MGADAIAAGTPVIGKRQATDDVRSLFVDHNLDPRLSPYFSAAIGTTLVDTVTGRVYQKISDVGPICWVPIDSQQQLETNAGTTMSFTGLNGDADASYEFCGMIRTAVGGVGANLFLRPNGLDTNQRSTWIDSDNGGAPGSNSFNAIQLAVLYTATTGVTYVRGHVAAASGRGARGISAQTWSQNSASGIIHRDVRGAWFDGTTKLISIDFTVDVAAAMGTGSWMAIRQSVPFWDDNLI
jgi:hypothetical protein